MDRPDACENDPAQQGGQSGPAQQACGRGLMAVDGHGQAFLDGLVAGNPGLSCGFCRMDAGL